MCSKRLNDDSPSWSSKTYCVLSGIIQSVQGLLNIGYRSVIKGEGEIMSNERTQLYFQKLDTALIQQIYTHFKPDFKLFKYSIKEFFQ